MDNMDSADPYVYLYVPKGSVYSAETISGQGVIDITMVDMNGSVSIQTDSSEVTISADDDSNRYVAEVGDPENSSYTINANGEIRTKTAGDETGGGTEDGKEAGTDGGAEAGAQAEAPFIDVNASVVKLKKGQATSGLKVSMLHGDQIASVSLSKKKVVKATVKDASAGIIRLKGKKVGRTKLTITLASGQKKTITVKVQKKPVKTMGITTSVSSGAQLKVGDRLNLGAAAVPFTSKEKLTFVSSDKKIAAVSRRGVVTARKEGTVTITIRSGKKKKRIRLRVAGIG